MSQLGLVVFGNKSCGKSTLCGQILYRYKECDDKTLKKAKDATKKLDRANSEYAFLCDTKDEDRKNGTSTTNLFKFSTSSSKQIYNLIDSCPANKNQNRLIHHGFGQCIIGILILESYQNKDVFNSLIDDKSDIYQQLIIAHSLGLQHIIICINKIDKDNINFIESLYNEYCEKIKAMIKSIGYDINKIPIIPICGYSGDNLFKISKDPNLKWWKGYNIKSTSNKEKTHKITTLMKGIKYLSKKAKKTLNSMNDPLCMTIKSRLEIDNVGTVFLSQIEIGQLNVGQTVLCCKSRENVLVKKYKIKSLETHGKNIKTATNGVIVGFTLTPNINDIDNKDQPNINDLICTGNKFKMALLENNQTAFNAMDYIYALPDIIKYNDRFIALIIILPEHNINKQTLKIEGANVFNNDLFFRKQTLNCSLLRILAKCKRKDNDLNNPLQETSGFGELTNGDQAEVLFGTKNPHFICSYDSINTYSRFVIIKEKIPIAIGKIIGININDYDSLKDGLYKFEAVHSGKYIDVKEISLEKSAVLHQWEWLNADNQKFYIKKQENGYYTVKCKHSGLYWDIKGASNADHARLIQYEFHGNDNQLFQIKHFENGRYSITAKHSSKSLDISGGSRENGGEIIQYTTHNGANQLFYCIAI